MTRIAIVIGLTCLLVPTITAQAQVVAVIRVVDARTSAPIPGAEVSVDAFRRSVRTGLEGLVSLPRGDTANLEVLVRRMGYAVRRVPLGKTSDTVQVALEPVAVSLAPVMVTVTGVNLPRVLEEQLRWLDHTRFLGPREFEASGRMLAGEYLLGRGGIVTRPCPPPPNAVPAGTRRSQPVDRDPNTLWWPCVPARFGTRPLVTMIDDGKPEPFVRLQSMPLDDIAFMAVSEGALVRAYTRDYLKRLREREASADSSSR